MRRSVNTRRKPRRDSRPPIFIAVSGLLVVASLALLGVLALRASNGLPLVDYRTLYAEVPDVGNLQPHSEVRVDGVRVGQVIRLSRSAAKARIEMKLSAGSGPLPPGTTVRVRGAGLLGQRYIDVRPGTGKGDLPDGATVPGGPNALASDVPAALATFDERTREGFASLFDELGEGLYGRGAGVNRGLRTAPITSRAFREVVDAVFQRSGALERLMPSMASAATAFDAARDPLARMLAPVAEGLEPIAARPEALGRTLDELPPTLQLARPALAEARELLSAARSLARAAAHELPHAPAALRETSALLRSARQPLARTTKLLRAADKAVPALLDITDAASPVLAPLRRTLRDLDPVFAVFGRHGCDIDNFAENWRSSLGYGTPDPGQSVPLPNGHIGGLGLFRITVLAGTESVQRFSTPSGSRGPEPYPAPCTSSPGPRYVEPDLTPGGTG
jgi:phospholipid/cholesterol/gamma-HCH transport system substrate-binding protein